MIPIKGKRYRQIVNSQQGYEDWEYTGISMEAPGGEMLYAFKSDRGVYYWDEKDFEYYNFKEM